jgi:hypothetical protein
VRFVPQRNRSRANLFETQPRPMQIRQVTCC